MEFKNSHFQNLLIELHDLEVERKEITKEKGERHKDFLLILDQRQEQIINELEGLNAETVNIKLNPMERETIRLALRQEFLDIKNKELKEASLDYYAKLISKF